MYAGISSKGNQLTRLSQLYQESDIALCSAMFYQHHQLMQYKGRSTDQQDMKMVLSMELAIKEADQLKINNLLTEWAGRCRDESITIDRLAIVYNQFISLLLKYFRSEIEFVELEHLSYDQLVRYYCTIEGLFNRLHSLFEQTNDKEVHISNNQAQKVIEFIDEHYTEDILFSELAKKFNLSIGYLSMLIKKETGKTYSEYITEKRLAFAKMLLSDSTISIHEIVQQIGYKDYFHFNKLFKKYYGITPSKYRKL
jgi:two-component system response regulator YesN